MSANNSWLLTHCSFLCCRCDGVHSGDIAVVDGLIAGLRSDDCWPADGTVRTLPTLDLGGGFVSAGLIDVQLNGGWGAYFTNDAAAVEAVARRLPALGVTSFLATLVSAPLAVYAAAVPLLQPRRIAAGAELLGVHLEGPYLQPDRRGAHPADLLLPHCPADPAAAYPDCPLAAVRLVTLAPELPGALPLIGGLAAAGICPAIGHSQADAAVFAAAKSAGARLVTHLFNAMPALHHRHDCQLPGHVLADDDLAFSIIADGVHVAPAVVKLAYRARPDGLLLVSDAMSALGLTADELDRLPDALPDLVMVDGQARIRSTGALAGSVLRMDDAVRNLRAFAGCTLAAALHAATSRPAALIGVGHRKGSIDIGKDADLVVWQSTALERVLRTFVNGQSVFTI